VTTAEPFSGHARWSPDAKRIAFLHRPSDATGPARILIMGAAAGPARAITPASIEVAAFEWSPSGRRIAFVSGGHMRNGLWVVDAAGNGLRMLSDGVTVAFAWAPDDSAIVRTTGERSTGPLRAEIIAVDGTTPSRAIAHDVAPSVSWSRDGTIALIGRRGPGLNRPNRLLLASAAGFAIREMPVAADSNLDYVVSLGDGQVSLTFMSNQGSWIERLTIATGERITLMPPGIARLFLTPSWSLDGTRYVVTAEDESRISDVFAGTGPPLAGGRPDVGAPRPVRRLTFSDR
jgi:Tol biopolymer transport system component